MANKEIFKVLEAQRVIANSKDNLTSEEWFNSNYAQIKDAVEILGYDLDNMIDVDFIDENNAHMYFLTGERAVVGVKDFRGYVLSKDDTVVIDDEILKSLCELDTYGDKDFKINDDFKIYEVCHNEVSGNVEYCIRCFIETKKPVVIEV